MLSEVLTFLLFLLIGLELRVGIQTPKQLLAPALCALMGMICPALIFNSLIRNSNAWAIAMPTDVALAVGVLSLLGKRIKPAVRFFILMLAVADDFLSLVAIGLFFRKDLNLSSAIYTMGAATIGFLLPYRRKIVAFLGPIASFLIIPIYILINLLTQLDFSFLTGEISTALVIARVLGKVIGISITGLLLMKFKGSLFSKNLFFNEIIGIGFLAGMGLTVSIVIAKITLTSSDQLAQVRVGLFVAAIISGICGAMWLLLFSSKTGAPRQD